MKNNELELFKNLVKKVGSYKSLSSPHKPKKAPIVKQLNEVYLLDKKTMTITSSERYQMTK